MGTRRWWFAHMDFFVNFRTWVFLLGGKLSAVSFSANCLYIAPRHETAFFSKQSHAWSLIHPSIDLKYKKRYKMGRYLFFELRTGDVNLPPFNLALLWWMLERTSRFRPPVPIPEVMTCQHCQKKSLNFCWTKGEISHPIWYWYLEAAIMVHSQKGQGVKDDPVVCESFVSWLHVSCINHFTHLVRF